MYMIGELFKSQERGRWQEESKVGRSMAELGKGSQERGLVG